MLAEKLAAAEARVKSLQSLLKDICGEWNEDCNPGCDSWGHDGDCKATNIAAAKRAMKAENAKLREALQKIDDPMKYHHWEEDPYTRAACFQFVASEALKA